MFLSEDVEAEEHGHHPEESYSEHGPENVAGHETENDGDDE